MKRGESVSRKEHFWVEHAKRALTAASSLVSRRLFPSFGTPHPTLAIRRPPLPMHSCAAALHRIISLPGLLTLWCHTSIFRKLSCIICSNSVCKPPLPGIALPDSHVLHFQLLTAPIPAIAGDFWLGLRYSKNRVKAGRPAVLVIFVLLVYCVFIFCSCFMSSPQNVLKPLVLGLLFAALLCICPYSEA